MPERFGSYTIHSELGMGGMASVHLADWKSPDGAEQRVALKRLFRHVADVPELLAMFIDEARLARYLRHPNIARVFEFGRISGVYFIAFEYVPGPTVQQLAQQCAAHVGPIPIAVVLHIARNLCDALDHAHNLCDEEGLPLGIVHRDISPSNLIVSNIGLVKLIDFGLAKAKYSSVESQAGIIKGKLNYVAPEYLLGALDIRCDLWAVGVVLHELLSGRRLFEADNQGATLDRVKAMPIPPPSRFNPEVSRELDEIVMTLLERDPSRRWQTAADLRTAIVAFSRHRVELTRAQLVAWVEWAFSQKQQIREDSAVSALSDIVSSGMIQEVDEHEDALSAARRLPAISAAMEERRRESISLSPFIGQAMLTRQGGARAWLWIAAVVAVVVAIALLAGCKFEHGLGGEPVDGADIDGAPDAVLPMPLHLGSGDGLPGDGALVLSGTLVIDTSATPTITGATLPAGDTFDVRPQLGGGPDLAVLHAGAVTVAMGAQVTVTGTRPFVIVAGGDVEIDGTLDGGARGATPGAGGALPGMGASPGQVGQHGASNSDSGGGGGGNGAAGGNGGGVACAPAVVAGGGGAAIADLAITTLDGGSGGGASSNLTCSAVVAGAGGGAIQVTSGTSIAISANGVVLAGGGGSAGGVDCGTGDATSAGGGGAGGAIVLQAPAIANAGVIAANGGAGGGGADGGVGNGSGGADAQPSSAAAAGGTGQTGANGGDGGAMTDATQGADIVCGANAGGGGGAAGRIAASSGYSATGVTSPAAYTMLPH